MPGEKALQDKECESRSDYAETAASVSRIFTTQLQSAKPASSTRSIRGLRPSYPFPVAVEPDVSDDARQRHRRTKGGRPGPAPPAPFKAVGRGGNLGEIARAPAGGPRHQVALQLEAEAGARVHRHDESDKFTRQGEEGPPGRRWRRYPAPRVDRTRDCAAVRTERSKTVGQVRDWTV